MGSPLRGQGSFVLDRNKGLESPFGSGVLVSFLDGPRTSVWGFSAHRVPQGVLPGGPRCVHELRLYLALSSVLYCPMLGLLVASTTLTTGLGLSLVPYPRSCRMGLEPRSEAPLCALQPLAHFFRVVLAEVAVLGSLLCAPLTVGPLPGPPALHYLRSAGCLLCLETSPSGEASASAWRFSWRPGAAGALTVAFTAAASLRELYPLCLVLPLRGSSTFLAFVPRLEALSESLPHSIPRSFLVVALSASAVGFADALWLCPEHALHLFFGSVSLVDTVALSPLSRSVYADGFPSLVSVLLLQRGVCPCVRCRRSPWGVAVAPPLSPYIGPGWSPPICRLPLGLRSVFHILLHDVPHVFTAIILSVSLTSACPWLVIPIVVQDEWLGWLTVPPPRSSRTLSFALTYCHDSLFLMHPAIDIVWRCPCLPRLRLLWPLAIAVHLVVFTSWLAS